MNTQKNNTSSVFSTNLAVLAQGSNENGEGNTDYYETRKSDGPKDCTLYKHVNAGGEVQYNQTGASPGVGWTFIQVAGIKELCPKDGPGCTAKTCHTTQ